MCEAKGAIDFLHAFSVRSMYGLSSTGRCILASFAGVVIEVITVERFIAGISMLPSLALLSHTFHQNNDDLMVKTAQFNS